MSGFSAVETELLFDVAFPFLRSEFPGFAQLFSQGIDFGFVGSFGVSGVGFGFGTGVRIRVQLVRVSIGIGIRVMIVRTGFRLVFLATGVSGAMRHFVLLHPINIICVLSFEAECTQGLGFTTSHYLDTETKRKSAEVSRDKSRLVPAQSCSEFPEIHVVLEDFGVFVHGEIGEEVFGIADRVMGTKIAFEL